MERRNAVFGQERVKELPAKFCGERSENGFVGSS